MAKRTDAAKKSKGKRAARTATRLTLATAAVSGRPVAKAAKELGVPTSTAYRMLHHPETTSIIEAMTIDRREDLTALFNRMVDSLLVDTLHLSDEGSTLSDRQAIRAEVLKVITLCNPPKKDEAPQSQNQGPHITFQTLVQFVNATSPPSTSNGPVGSLDLSTEKFPNPSI